MTQLPSLKNDKDPGLQEMSPVLKSIFTMYPANAKAILEVECGNGERIRTGRLKHINVFGVDKKDYSEDWNRDKLDIYCRQADYNCLPFNDKSFDWVIVANNIKWSTGVISECQRVCNGHFYYKFFMNGISDSEIIKKLVGMGHVIEIAQKSLQKTFIVEGRTG